MNDKKNVAYNECVFQEPFKAEFRVDPFEEKPLERKSSPDID